ncbi:putative aldouronate transport system substrate-binding protein [Paenibacillus sp. UNCCL117]|uniref:ABC transporter substrate-binding protein n=1 Tax=unclassified Paenibacillus TaxID=185978 RepID=UPI000881DBE0|nr:MULTISPECIES: ABC transporter substrate-binding protein [unclassified Paenibacillus]SDD07052.1 putative aldouronate transport system substrate-binding protein [Paenibacillus sp. cl123]SFW31567.1 putative aldouronate transport system substrate-binding protein [Paenibacillus sp. UNCCL117]
MKAKRMTTALLSVIMAGSTLAACSNSGKEAAGSPGGSPGGGAPAPVTLKGMLFGDEPKDLALVLEEFEKRTKDSLNTKLEIQWNPVNDHKQKVKLMMAAGESVDFVFDADFQNLKELVPQGAYAQLDKYFNNDEYPGLKKAFSKEFIDMNKRYDDHLYTIPFTQYYYDIPVVYIRKDLREKLGFAKPIASYQELQQFYDKVLEAEKGVTPLALRGASGYQDILAPDDRPDLSTVRSILLGGITYFVHLTDDLKKVQRVVALGDPEAEWAALPAPYNTMKSTFAQYDKWAEWSKYLEKDVLSQKDQKAYFMSGKAASYYGTLSSYAADKKKLKDTIQDADLEFFVFREKMRNMEPKAISTNYKANNSLAIPASSKHIDRTMKFFDWLFQSRENHDLFEYGIQGKHWEPVGDNQLKLLDDSKNYNFPGYEFTWNPNMIRLPADLDETAKKYFEYSAKEDTYYAGVLAKFAFDTSNVKGEFANVQSKADPFVQTLKAGQIKDWETSAAKLNNELKGLGLEKIRAELQKQVQEYLDKGGK